MAFLTDNIPYFKCFVRGEYLRNLKRGHGEFVPGYAHAIRCRRGHSFWFQVNLCEPYGGAAFRLPITALTTNEYAPVLPVQDIQPWDALADTFSVVSLRFVAHQPVRIRRQNVMGNYLFSVDFGTEDLPDDPEQSKILHVIAREDGNIGAYPNNRLQWHDPAFWEVSDARPDFEALAAVVRAESLVVSDTSPTPEDSVQTSFALNGHDDHDSNRFWDRPI